MSGDPGPSPEISTIVYNFDIPNVATQSTPTGKSLITNLVAFYLMMFLFFGSYASLFNLQSSLHFSTALGTASLCAIYASSLVCYACLSSLIITRLGLSRTITGMLALMVPFFAAHFYPVWYILVPASLLAGIAASTLWTCIPTYLTQVTELCHDVFKLDLERSLPRFFALAFVLVQAAVLVGSATAYYILRPEGSPMTWHNESIHGKGTCGPDFCDTAIGENSTLRATPNKNKVYLLCGVFGICVLLASAISAIFITNFRENTLSREQGSQVHFEEKSTVNKQFNGSRFRCHFIETMSFLRKSEVLLLAPITFYQGLETAFVSSEFTKAYISCTLGVHFVSWVLCSYAALYMIGSFLLQGPALQCVGRPALLCFGATVGLSTLLVLLFWKAPYNRTYLPTSDENNSSVLAENAVLFIAAGSFGIAGSALHPQLKTLYGLLFCEHKAQGFAIMGMIDSVGGLVGFSLGSASCVRPKIYIMVVAQTVGIASYLCFEWKISKIKKKHQRIPNGYKKAKANVTFEIQTPVNST